MIAIFLTMYVIIVQNGDGVHGGVDHKEDQDGTLTRQWIKWSSDKVLHHVVLNVNCHLNRFTQLTFAFQACAARFEVQEYHAQHPKRSVQLGQMLQFLTGKLGRQTNSHSRM